MNKIKMILTSLACLGNLILTISYPVIVFFLGRSGNSSAYLIVIALTVLVLIGWSLIIRTLMFDVSQWAFDLGCGWGQYLDSNHYKKFGSVQNQELFEDGFSIFARADDVLRKFYYDVEFSFDSGSSHAVSVAKILEKDYENSGVMENGQIKNHWMLNN